MLTENIINIANVVTGHNSFLLAPHERPDGDACGSMLALADALADAGKHVHKILLSPPGPRYEFLFEDRSTPILGTDITVDELPQVEVAVIIDTSATRQLVPLMPWLNRFPGTVLAVDHHQRGDLACHAELIDPTAPAAGLLICTLLDHLGWLGGRKIADHLLMAIGTDTGWFSYNNTTADCFRWAARLGDMGASIHDVYEKLFLAESPQRFRLVARTLSSAELLADGRIVAFTLTRDDFQRTDASEANTENLIDYAARLKTMKLAALFVEADEQTVRVSLRSREPFDVHDVAKLFGGGGHRHAAGIKLTGTLHDVKKRILNKLIDILDKT